MEFVMWKRLAPPLLGGLSVVAALLAIIDIPQIALPLIARISIGALAVVAAAIYLRVHYVEAPKTLGRPHLEQPPAEQIAQAREDVSNRYTKQQIDQFFSMLTDLPSHLVRITEEVELEERSLRVATKLTYQYFSQGRLGKFQEEDKDEEGPKALLVPVVTPEKGTLIDSLRITDGSGDEITTLSQYDMRGLLALTLETLLRLAIKEESDPGIVGQNELLMDEEGALEELIGLVCHVGPPAEEDYRYAFDRLHELPSISYEWKLRLKDFCCLYATHYAIVGEVTRPSNSQVSLSYSQRLHTENTPSKQHDRLRRRFGLSPYTIELPLALYAFMADSYHLQINAGQGQYVFDHHLEEVGSREIIEQDSLIDKPDPQIGPLHRPYVRINKNGRTNAHLYIRRQRILGHTAELKSVFEFREIPPGTLGGAAVVAGASAVIITFFALTHFGLDGPYPDIPPEPNDVVRAALNSDLPAILLSLPAFVAALIGPWSDLSRIARASLSTYFGLVTTLLLSVASVLYYIFDANRLLPTEVGFHILGGAHIKTDMIWITLMFIAIFLFSRLLRELMRQSRYYFNLVEYEPSKTVNVARDGREGQT
jgi:hypothetical protein